MQISFFICKSRTVYCRIQSNSTVTVLYLVSLLFAPPILHPTNHFFDREVFYLLVFKRLIDFIIILYENTGNARIRTIACSYQSPLFRLHARLTERNVVPTEVPIQGFRTGFEFGIYSHLTLHLIITVYWHLLTEIFDISDWVMVFW